MYLEANHVRLFLDGREVASQAVKSRVGKPVDGDLALGRLVEGGIGCEGELAWVRISSGLEKIREPIAEFPAVTERTLGYWKPSANDAETPDLAKPKTPARKVAVNSTAPHGHAVHGNFPLPEKLPPLPEYDPKPYQLCWTKRSSTAAFVAGSMSFRQRSLPVYRVIKLASMAGR